MDDKEVVIGKISKEIRDIESDIIFESLFLSNVTGNCSIHDSYTRCKFCNTVFNMVDFSDGECPFCRH